MMVKSPFGRYANAAATLTALSVLAASLLTHVLGHPDTLIDSMALIAFGLLVGQQGASAEATVAAAERINGQEAKINAAHKRLDEIHAPAAESGPVTAEGAAGGG